MCKDLTCGITLANELRHFLLKWQLLNDKWRVAKDVAIASELSELS